MHVVMWVEIRVLFRTEHRRTQIIFSGGSNMAEDDEFEISLNDLDELQAEESGSSSSSEEDRMEDVAIEELKPMDAAAIVKLLSSGRLQEHIKVRSFK